QGPALLVGDNQRVLRVARRVPGREVHALEVIEIGLDLRSHANRVTERGEDRRELIERAGNGVLGADEPLGAGEGDVDGLSRQKGVAWPRAGRLLEQTFDQFLESLEALAYGLFGRGRCSLEPAAGNLVEQTLLTAQPAQAKSLHRVRAAKPS